MKSICFIIKAFFSILCFIFTMAFALIRDVVEPYILSVFKKLGIGEQAIKQKAFEKFLENPKTVTFNKLEIACKNSASITAEIRVSILFNENIKPHLCFKMKHRGKVPSLSNKFSLHYDCTLATSFQQMIQDAMSNTPFNNSEHNVVSEFKNYFTQTLEPFGSIIEDSYELKSIYGI